MEQDALKDVNNCFNTNIYSYLETTALNVIEFSSAVIYEFLYKVRVFVRLGWKILPGTNTQA